MIGNICWLMVVISIIATFANSKQNKWCFYLYIITGCWWFWYNFYYIGEIQQGLLRLFYVGLAIYGLYNWKKKENYTKDLEKKLEVYKKNGVLK